LQEPFLLPDHHLVLSVMLEHGLRQEVHRVRDAMLDIFLHQRELLQPQAAHYVAKAHSR
jgi:adenylate kinase